MNNAALNLNSIRQPSPNVNQEEKQKRKFNLPNVGVVSVPIISQTPLGDTIELKRKENPKMAYKPTPESKKEFKIQNIFSITIIGCSIAALLKGKK